MYEITRNTMQEFKNKLTFEGIGWYFMPPGPGRKPVYRFKDPHNLNSLFSISKDITKQPNAKGYEYKGIAGYHGC